GTPNNDLYDINMKEVDFSTFTYKGVINFKSWSPRPGKLLVDIFEIEGSPFTSIYCSSSGWDGLSLNNAPGGIINLQKMFNEDPDNENSKIMEGTQDGSCFITIPSAFGIKMTAANTHRVWVANYTNGEITKAEMAAQGLSTPFDVCMVQRSNQEHVNISLDIKEFVLKYLDSLDKSQEILLPQIQHNEYDFANEETTVGYRISLGSQDPNREVSVVVNSAQIYTANAADFIRMLPGYEVKAGAEHHAYISAVQSSCYVIPDPNAALYGPIVSDSQNFNVSSHSTINNATGYETHQQSSEMITSVEGGLSYNTYLFPNPTQDLVTINVNPAKIKNAQITVSDVTGNVIMYKEITQEKTSVDLNGYSSGIYLFKITDSDGTKTFKIVKTQ
ncbi:MAG: T9SS type A sorting domain-containing protein, partial [Bacteroidetes bacterium]|nr:T9SS type A sorting domain-containing protein [Bacteroidota bacterium]